MLAPSPGFKNKKKEKHSLFSPLPPQQVEVVRGERRKKEKIKQDRVYLN